MILNQDFKEFVQSLNNNQVHYLVAGGYAVALHGSPRYTKAIDVWIELSQDNAGQMVAALDEFSFASLGLKPSDFQEPGQVIQLGYPPNRIDILSSIQGVEFAACYDKRVIVEIEGIKVSFIDLDNLKRTKKATGRLQDLADIENLEP
jgi:hypothetical protein